jgi:hypothetical protein
MCSTAEDWMEFPTQFQNSTHQDEKLFYKYLRDTLVPLIIKDLEIAKVKKQKRDEVDAQKLARKLELEEQRQYYKELERARQEELALEKLKQAEEESKKDEKVLLLRSGRQSRVIGEIEPDEDEFILNDDAEYEESTRSRRSSKRRK